ncbi:hypothetical protein MSAN_00974700 [Mycena sanguinolenta]|uniref:Uncharacterized protein n=1 Tax=Mycena sanguinolenta TaxID=230812 RepID=A0A8H7DAC4_9AGAR|nr:hypothetical protein MSAN_00974700 [Mycena sanguinolenta]
MGKSLFVINRYYALTWMIINNYALFSSALTDSVRHPYIRSWPEAYKDHGSLILQMRLYALYFLDKKVLVLMVTAFIVSSVSSAVIIASVLERAEAASHPFRGLTLCVLNDVPDYLFAFWIPIACFESLLCGLALYRGLRTFCMRATLLQSTKHLILVLIRDSVFYFLIILSNYLLNIFTFISFSTSVIPVSMTPFTGVVPAS